jgi:hypothetical protein
MAATIKTSGQLREFLSDLLIEIRNGKIEPETARNITKMAAQINESFYSEIKLAKLMAEVGKEAVGFGDLPINK